MANISNQQIRAVYNENTIRVYQAYGHAIADLALAHGTFVSPPFKMDRMTWIKPSFLWMMYRSGWGFKDDGQRRILAIDITRQGLEWALSHSCPSRAPAGMSNEDWATLKAASPIRIQWDPERDLHLQPLPYRTIQIGISGEAVQLYVSQWIQKITDVTELAHSIHDLVKAGNMERAAFLVPQERELPQNYHLCL